MSRLLTLGLCAAAYLLSGCASTADFAELRSEFHRTHTVLRTELAEARTAARDNQREIEIVKGTVDEIRHQNEIRSSQPSEDSKQLADMKKTVLLLEKTVQGEREKTRQLQDDLRAMREESRIQREEIKTMRSAMTRLADRFQSSSPEKKVSACELLQPELIQAPDEYQEALRRMCGGDFRGAIAKFREFEKKFPKSALGENAQYWIGEAYFSVKEYERAILEFQEVVRSYPRSGRVPMALLRQGFSFYELGHWDDARLVLEKLIQEFPETREAEKARTKLGALAR